MTHTIGFAHPLSEFSPSGRGWRERRGKVLVDRLLQGRVTRNLVAGPWHLSPLFLMVK
ncbi:MAG TPA: hypothetical protein VFG95_03960 [Nitrospiria bacterium]|nr:hypothetical protein [Nitrospiria bacterium]